MKHISFGVVQAGYQAFHPRYDPLGPSDFLGLVDAQVKDVGSVASEDTRIPGFSNGVLF